MTYQGHSRERGSYGDKREKPALYGIWEVETFVKNNDTIPPLITDGDRWQYLILDWKNQAVIQYMDGKKEYIDFSPNVDLTSADAKSYLWSNEEIFKLKATDTPLQIQGEILGEQMDVHLKAKDLSKFELTNRGFHWVNEYPYNR